MKIAFLGDIALIGKYDYSTNPEAVNRLAVLAEHLSQYDYVVANLESPLTNRSSSFVCKSMHLRSPTTNVELLKCLNIKAVSLANNHIFDFGKQGLIDTISVLERNNIEWFGVSSKDLVKEIAGEKVSFSGFCCYSTNGTGYQRNGKLGVNLLTSDTVKDQLEKDKRRNAFSILSIHWGLEHTNYPNYEHVIFAQNIALTKNVVVHGHHPHVIQGIQSVNDSLIAYSLGNCLFDECTNLKGTFTLKQNESNKKSFVLEVEIKEKSLDRHKIHGFKDEERGLRFCDIDLEMQKISRSLDHIKDKSEYEEMRRLQFNDTIEKKFGKRDFKWLMSRMNYHSIGARAMSIIRQKRYGIEVNKFLRGV